MNTHFIQRRDKSVLYIDGQYALDIAEDLKQGKDIWYKGRLIPRNQIIDFGEVAGSSAEENTGSVMLKAQHALPAPTSRKPGFWFEVVKINQGREELHKPYIYARAIEQARGDVVFANPQDLFDFIDSDYKTYEDFNKPDLKGLFRS